MALTRDSNETFRARVQRDPGFREALLREGIENFLSGDVETGKIILRNFINATVGFHKLSEITHRSAKNLMRMLRPHGNPQARNLFRIVKDLQETLSCSLKFGLGAPPHLQSAPSYRSRLAWHDARTSSPSCVEPASSKDIPRR